MDNQHAADEDVSTHYESDYLRNQKPKSVIVLLFQKAKNKKGKRVVASTNSVADDSVLVDDNDNHKIITKTKDTHPIIQVNYQTFLTERTLANLLPPEREEKKARDRCNKEK